MRPAADRNPIPVFLHRANMHFGDLGIVGEEMPDRFDRELLCQDVEGVFYRVGGQDLTIIAGGMSRLEVALELDRKSEVPNLVLLFPPGNAQESHARLSVIILSQSYVHRISSRDRSNSR